MVPITFYHLSENGLQIIHLLRSFLYHSFAKVAIGAQMSYSYMPLNQQLSL